MFRSALLKLTLGYVAIIMLLSLVFSVVLYHFGTVELKEGLNRQYSVLIGSDHDTDNILGLSEEVFSGRAGQLYVDLVYFNLVILVLAGFGSYGLAKRTLKPIEAAHGAQVRFTAHASHELRTPLAAIKADTESVLMLKDPGVKLLKKTLRANLEDVEHIESLANRLLEVSRIRSTSNLPKSQVKLGELIKSCIRTTKRTPNAKKFKFDVSIIDLITKGDPESLEVVITTVLDNAIKYSPSGSTIQISLKREGHDAVFVVKDEGPGISPQDIAHVFEPFYRAKATRGVKAKGYGLGLSLAKEIVEAHSGTIKIETIEAHGTSVIIRLPLA